MHIAGVLLCLGAAGAAWAQQHAPHANNPTLDENAALAISQAAIGRSVGDYSFTDSRGKTLRLKDLRGQPLLISLIYTSCYHTCPLLTKHLAQVVEIAREALGDTSFAVLTIGFDTAVDTPERMRTYARERGISISEWFFLSADPATMGALTRDVGFIYFASPRGFDHLAQTTLLDAQGRVYAQIYGENFATPTLVEPLKQLVFGTPAQARSLSGWINGVRLFCTIYDPSTGRYRFDYSLFIAIGVGIFSLGAVAVFVVRAWRQGSPPTSAA
ncbi:MAG: SCO family protein [Acidiferrobacterales bacterium]|nr:SCO family protein [Acidiferrobacterales bacterium]